jgi:hypothetical protein
MYSFPQIDGELNTVGYTSFYFVPISGVTSIPREVDKKITEDIVSDDFYIGYSPFGSLSFNDQPTITEMGVRYPVSLGGVAPVDKPEYLELFTQMIEKEFLVLVKDANGRVKLCGNKNKGLKFSYETTSVGYAFKFSGEFATPPPFYFGDYTVDNISYNSPNIPGVVYTVGGKWILGSGAPASATGRNGDVYLDGVTNLYYEKENNVWTVKGYIGPDQTLQQISIHYSYLAITGNI